MHSNIIWMRILLNVINDRYCVYVCRRSRNVRNMSFFQKLKDFDSLFCPRVYISESRDANYNNITKLTNVITSNLAQSTEIRGRNFALAYAISRKMEGSGTRGIKNTKTSREVVVITDFCCMS